MHFINCCSISLLIHSVSAALALFLLSTFTYRPHIRLSAFLAQHKASVLQLTLLYGIGLYTRQFLSQFIEAQSYVGACSCTDFEVHYIPLISVILGLLCTYLALPL